MTVDTTNMLANNVILVDSSYIDKIAFDFTVNFERILERRVSKADLALWLDCISLDAGLEPGENDIQVIFLYKQDELKNYQPSNIKEDIDGKAFRDNLGEFGMEAYALAEDVTSAGDQFAETLRVLLDAEAVKNIILVPDMETYGEKVKDVLNKNTNKRAVLFAIQPQTGLGFNLQQLGFSIVHALGIRSEEFNK